jgi:hypothetical protein
MRTTLLLLFVCLLPTVALAGQRSERSLYQRPDGEWFLCKGQACDQPVPPPAWAPLPERQTPTDATPLHGARVAH